MTNNDAVSFLIIDGTEPSDYTMQYNCTAINQFGEDSLIISLREEGERSFICHTMSVRITLSSSIFTRRLTCHHLEEQYIISLRFPSSYIASDAPADRFGFGDALPLCTGDHLRSLLSATTER